MTIQAQPDTHHSIRGTHWGLLIIWNTTLPRKIVHNMNEWHKQKGVKEARLQWKNSVLFHLYSLKQGKLNYWQIDQNIIHPWMGSEQQENTLLHLWEIVIFPFFLYLGTVYRLCTPPVEHIMWSCFYIIL